MLNCWNSDPAERPTFTQIVSILNGYAGSLCSFS